jgi:CheY-like chemotaxis protein
MKKQQIRESMGKLAQELPLRILIAEDNIINQKLLMQILDMLGYKADAVSDGPEVLTTIKEKTYDLVLMDIQMPEMGGEETTAQLRQQLNDHTPKIIAVTAYAMAGDREKYLKAGMDGYISKPFKIDDLVTEIKKVMSGKQA